MEETNNKNKRLRTIAGVVIAVVISTVMRKYIFTEDTSISSKLKTASEETNRRCPIVLDSMTTLSNTIALPHNTFQYNYNVKIDTALYSLTLLKTNLRESILNSVKTNPSMKDFKDNKVTLDYSYSDAKGDFLFKIELTPEDYK